MPRSVAGAARSPETGRPADSVLAGPEQAAVHGLQETARLFYERGWAFGTSGNYSVVLGRDPLRLLVTASGKDKRVLGETDFVLVDATGQRAEARSLGVGQPAGAGKPSAETLLHTTLADVLPGVGSVLHTHSVWNTILSDQHFGRGELTISGYEMLKGLSGITSHEARVSIAIFENTQDIPDLAAQLRQRLRVHDGTLRHAFLIRSHGLYTWGRDLGEARRHVEILEFLFEVLGRRGVPG